MNLQFARVDLVRDREVLTRFNVAYLNWVAAGVEERFALSLAELLGATIPTLRWTAIPLSAWAGCAR